MSESRSRLSVWMPAILLLMGLSFGVGWLWRGALAVPDEETTEETLYYCPMHPALTSPDFALCPDCGMDMIELDPNQELLADDEVLLTPRGRRMTNVRTVPVERRTVSKSVRLVGQLDYDETRRSVVSARVSGWIERQFVDYTGIRVARGDHLLQIYSPELLTSQQELLSAMALPDGELALQTAREKLRLMGLTEEQIAAIEERGTAEDRVLVHSPAAGIVTQKRVSEGDHVAAGATLYSIAELDQLWLMLHAYEYDVPWIRYGQQVEVETDAHPGRAFRGWISYVDTEIDAKTRTVRLRVQLDNEDGTLKPGMFARAIVRSQLSDTGAVIAPELAGKWISPMHPEVVKDGPGSCDVCGMPLVPAEKLGLVADASPEHRPIVVPASAVLRTGRRAVVYVERSANNPSERRYVAREISLGPRAGEVYIVLDGLAEGEHVVANGAFKLDSELQIRTQQGMMALAADGAWLGPEAMLFRRSVTPLFERYFEVQRALAADDADGAHRAWAGLQEALDGVDGATLPLAAQLDWRGLRELLERSVAAVEPEADIETLRIAFGPLAVAVLQLEHSFGHQGAGVFREVYCPMAYDDRGAAWLQTEDVIANPYFGATMLRCGMIEGEHHGRPAPREGGR